MSERKNRTDISEKARKAAHIRDGGRCVYCGRTDKPLELAHFISRAQGGLGIPQNLVSLCGDCHKDYDGEKHSEMRPYLEQYLKSKYSNWDESILIFKRSFSDANKRL